MIILGIIDSDIDTSMPWHVNPLTASIGTRSYRLPYEAWGMGLDHHPDAFTVGTL